MNSNWMARYIATSRGAWKEQLAYLQPLSDAQIEKERVRLKEKWGNKYMGNVKLMRMGKGSQL